MRPLAQLDRKCFNYICNLLGQYSSQHSAGGAPDFNALELHDSFPLAIFCHKIIVRTLSPARFLYCLLFCFPAKCCARLSFFRQRSRVMTVHDSLARHTYPRANFPVTFVKFPLRQRMTVANSAIHTREVDYASSTRFHFSNQNNFFYPTM